MRSYTSITKSENKDSLIQQKTLLRVGKNDDQYEKEADKTADAVISGIPRRSFSKISIRVPVQRQKPTDTKSNEKKYEEAAKKTAEAFLETTIGKEIKKKAEQLGDDFIATLPGKIITGTGITSVVAALVATHKELPVGIPEIPLDKIKPGLKLKLTIEGPLDKPTKVTASFSFPLGVPKVDGKKTAMSKAEQYRGETVRIAAEQQRFRESLKTPGQRAQEQSMFDAWVLSNLYVPGRVTGVPGQTSGPPLRPLASEFKISGEQPKREEPRKKEEEPLQRKKNSNKASVQSTPPPIVNMVLNSPGKPLDPDTRSYMEGSFGYDFSGVRIHTDYLANQSADALDASAYTVGNKLVFAKDQYSPATLSGRHLLAHELTHVIQQNSVAQKQLRRMVIRRRKKSTVHPPPSPVLDLKTSLKGDDDSVRALTKSPQWKDVTFTAEEAASLIVLLLKGSTLDEDETAGLAVLKSALAQGIFDDSLKKLGDKGRFKQLLGDYHGLEYQSLLDLLSKNISKLQVKALYLDSFIAMYWVREHEERAIVVLLERTLAADLMQLFAVQNRETELRNAIDADALSIRYEKIVSKTNEHRLAQLSVKLEKFFTAHSITRTAVGKRTPDELKELMAGAVIDLTSDLSIELKEYRNRLDKALTAKHDPDSIAKINREFEQRLELLLRNKKQEFRFEIKYGVELNRFLSDVKGKSWTLQDFDKIDKILAQIPVEILNANPRFKAIQRAGSHPDKSGEAEWSGKTISFFGLLSVGTTAHELGHNISYDDSYRLQGEFDRTFKWERLTVVDLTRLIPNRSKRDELIAKLDKDRAEKRQAKKYRYKYASHYYRYNRYNGVSDIKNLYLRHPENACFISNYAANDRVEDFAEVFKEYIINPPNLHKKCPRKYGFMRGKVFVGYLFGKLKTKAMADYDRKVAAKLKGVVLSGRILFEFQYLILPKLRAALQNKLATTGASIEKASLATIAKADMDRTPIPTNGVRLIARPYHKLLDDLFNLLGLAAKPWQRYWSEIEQFKVGTPKKYSLAGVLIGHELRTSFQGDILKLLQHPAGRITSGTRVTMKKWPKLEVLYKKYKQALKVAPSYWSVYKRLAEVELKIELLSLSPPPEKEEVGPTAWAILRHYPATHPRRQELKDYILKRRQKLGKELKTVQQEIIRGIIAGIPLSKSIATRFNTLVRVYKKDIKVFIKRKKIRLSKKV